MFISSLTQETCVVRFWSTAATAILVVSFLSSECNQLFADEHPASEVKVTEVKDDGEETHAPERKAPAERLCSPAIPAGVKERPLFDGKSLAGWKITKFGGEGTVKTKDGILELGFGTFMTGVTYAGKEELPKTNYEILLDAQRADGTDFFCGLTVPYHDSHFSLIVGGWGGGVTGISSIDGLDASENDTTRYIAYKNDVWYCLRLRVTDEKITLWVDDKEQIAFPVDRETFSTRIEVDLSKPLGISSFDTQAKLRNIRLRTWQPPAEQPPAENESPNDS